VNGDAHKGPVWYGKITPTFFSDKYKTKGIHTMLILECSYQKKVGLPQYSSHQFSVTLRTEIADLANVQTESARLYALLQQSVDESLQQPGFRPGPNGNGNSHNQSWGCSEKQRGLILRLVQEHQLDKALVEQLSQDRFGKSLKSLTRLEASSLIEALIDKTGGSTKNQRRRFNDRGNPANAR